MPAVRENAPIEVGIKFRSDLTGSISGVRFYQGPGNTGPHAGSLWTVGGTRLASATATSDPAPGWRTATFAEPVPIDADTTYVASYFARCGHFSVSYDYFTCGKDSAPLHASVSTVADPNGVFRYAATSGFPTKSHRSANYWVDVLFTPGPGPVIPTPLDQGFGGPVLLVKSNAHPFSRYLSEILRAEGITSFTTTDLATLTASTLAQHDVVLLGAVPLTTAQVTMLTDHVTGGGNLIAMRPDKKLLPLLGLVDQGGTLAEGYLRIATSCAPGHGLPDQTMQFHGTADRYTAPAGTATLATLYSKATVTTNSPAVSLRVIGNGGGHAVAFTYDLARSVIYTHQGNPAWVGDERHGRPPLRPVDLFYGAKKGDVRPDWVDLNKVAIPQADEQQRLLANIVNFVNQDRKPIPKTWYLPKGHKAAVVMALDDHGTEAGARGFFDRLAKLAPPGAKPETWDAPRGTSWLFVDGPTLTDAEAAEYVARGFDLGVHVNTGGLNWTPVSLEAAYHADLHQFAERFPSLPRQTGHRTHCIVWSDWATQPKVELSKGIRLDLNYYYAPDYWVRNRPGMFTGSGLPMRFADLDGTMIDVYQVTSHLVNENGQAYPAGINTLLDRAIGHEGYYGVFGSHFDLCDYFDVQVMRSAKERGIPMVSGKQLLDWTDGRNNSYFVRISWSGNDLTFTAHADARTNGMLRGLLPVQSRKGALTRITRDTEPVGHTQQTIKGVTYAMFPVATGTYTAQYSPHTYPASLWTPSTVPGNVTAADTTPGELGVRFAPGVTGRITAVRFYKGPRNIGPHPVSVWSSTGVRLGTATATDVDDAATGWQTVRLPAPITVLAGGTYVASYFCPGGHYSYDHDYFGTAHTSGPLTAPSSTGCGGNGVYGLGRGVFPTRSYRDLNYWVDVVFTR